MVSPSLPLPDPARCIRWPHSPLPAPGNPAPPMLSPTGHQYQFTYTVLTSVCLSGAPTTK